MKTLPITIVGYDKLNKENALIREYLRQSRLKTNKVLLIDLPKQTNQMPNLITEKESIDFSKKFEQLSKEIFGK